MGDLVRIFERFLGRDLVYILAGAIPLLCLGRILWVENYLCKTFPTFRDLMSLSGVSWVWVALAAGAAYAVGYAGQELFCLLRLSSTAIEGNPERLIRRLFRSYQRRDLTEIPRTFNERDAAIDLEMSDDRHFGAHLERRVYLMQVGTALGPGLILGGGFLIASSLWRYLTESIDALDEKASVGLVISGLSYLCLRALNGGQLNGVTAQSLWRWEKGCLRALDGAQLNGAQPFRYAAAAVAVGSCRILILSWRWPWVEQSIGASDAVAGLVLQLAGLFFLVLGALKRAQLREYVFLVHRWLYPGAHVMA